ncbi:LysR family transcriptional regulator [Halomonas sp. V046]|uniref:LysR family transcriptional regulator n=1 Tax=Halomonas sp. V046 TaxID=3459611 RepID=UPI004044DFC3
MALLTTALRYFEEVARQGSLRKAADRLHVAASAVNRQVLKLEDELGVPLFERLPRGLRLSSAGELLLYQVRQWQRDERQLLGVLSDIRGLGCVDIRIAAVESLTDLILPAVMAQFRHRYPRVRFHLVTGLTEEIQQLTASGEADLGVCMNPSVHPRLREIQAVALEFGAVVAPSHPLALRSQVRLQDCAEFPAILPDRDMYRGSTLEQALGHGQVNLTPVADCSRVLSLKSLARAGLGVAFLNPLDIARELQHGELVFVALRDKHVTDARLVLCAARDRAMPLALAVFCEMLSEALDELGKEHGSTRLEESSIQR